MYTPNELLELRNELNIYLDENKDYPFKLVYATKKNINKIDKEIDEFRDTLESDAEGFDEFVEARFNAAVDAGGEVQPLPNGGKRISNPEEIDNDKFQEKLDELSEEYKDILEEQEKIEESRAEKAQEEVIEINWYYLRPSFFPETIKPKELPNGVVNLIKEDEE